MAANKEGWGRDGAGGCGELAELGETGITAAVKSEERRVPPDGVQAGMTMVRAAELTTDPYNMLVTGEFI